MRLGKSFPKDAVNSYKTYEDTKEGEDFFSPSRGICVASFHE
jgi:hypothetical protein